MAKIKYDPSKRIYGILYASTTALFWGFLAIFIKITIVDVAPVTIVWFRFSVAFLFLSGYFLWKDPKQLLIFRKPPPLIIVAALGLTLNYIGFAMGILYTSPGNSQIFIQLGPILLAVSGIVIFKERLSLRQLSGFLVAGAGFVLFYRDHLANLLGSHHVYQSGIVWLVVAAMAWSSYSVLQKYLVQKHPAQQLNLVIFGLPMLILIPFVDFQAFAHFEWGTWLLLLFLGVNTLVAYGCLAEAFRYLEANKVSVIITLNPIITFITMAVLAFMEVSWIAPEILTVFSLLGALLVISGAILVIIPKRLRSIKQP